MQPRSDASSMQVLFARRAAFTAAVLALWWLVGAMQFWPDYLFPSPSGVAQSIGDGFEDGTIPRALAGSMRRLFLGYAIATIAGLVIGVLLARVRWLKETLGLAVMGLQALPSICWLPLALLWFGLSEKAIVFVVVMGAVLSIAQAAEDGVRNTPPIYGRAARNLGARGWSLYTAVVFPAALPAIVSGMKLGWSFAWRSLMAGELLYTLPGLGNLLMMGRELNDMARVVAIMIVIVAIGLVTDRMLFGVWERGVRRRWGLES